MDDNKTPPNWKRPKDVMKLHSLRMKKRALQFRFTDQENTKTTTSDVKDANEKKFSSRNPFKRTKNEPAAHSEPKKFNADINDDTTTDGTLFRLLNFSSQTQSQSDSSNAAANISFANAFSVLNSSQSSQPEPDACKREDILVDWTLRVKVRLMSTHSFPWNRKLKTCEEASGITGFVRCIDTDTENGAEINLDTSPNARFHQCCLVWQHPSIPWLDLYPRVNKRMPYSLNVSLLPAKDAMYSNWVDSFRSLFQLVRAKQCPYFYVMTNSFVCLFRAAGIHGYSEMNAAVTPTSRGFRQMLKDEDIDFTMPLKVANEKKSPVTNDSQDTGYDSLGLGDDDTGELAGDDNDEEDTDEWLQNIGIEETEIKKLNTVQLDINAGREKAIDKIPESLVFVEGVEAQALFNFLLNCKSIIPINGSLAGVPPTLLSPVAFTGASLTSLKVKESVIRMNETSYHSMEIRGPILPHMVHNLCDLMKSSTLDKFSLTFADVESSKAFTAATAIHTDATKSKSPVKTPRTPSVFGEQNLSDCGLKPKVLARFCKNEVIQFDSIKYSDSHYTCS